LELSVISNRGVKVWPDGRPETFCTGFWCLRFTSSHAKALTLTQITQHLESLERVGVNFVKIENLYEFDGESGFSKVQGA
jgi:isocitrate dehydrogenase